MSGARYPSRALVDLDAYAANIAWARESSGIPIMAVVKGNGYGLGAVPLARRALEAGSPVIGVATPGEGIALREAGIQGPVLVLMQPDPDAFPELLDFALTPALCDVAAARSLDALARDRGQVFPVHAMIDTGMGRQGFALETAVADLSAIAGLPNIRLAGIATHYPVADITDDPFTREQVERLRGVVGELRAAHIDCGMVHGANSAGVVNARDPLFTMARAGILTTGVWPTDTVPEPNPIRPVLQWVTRVSQVRALPPGHTVSYGRTYTARDGMIAAILPVGYADGYRRAFSNRAEVLIRGHRCPVRGRVCMDQTVVDVTGVPGVVPGDEAVLAGGQGEDRITLEELAAHADTIPYEILTGIGQRVERVYVEAAPHTPTW
ncbi:MAG: alanine racemase [Candidatus Hydrogenedentes bacterium]|nr:alanine racemase [Candidatus Hydrogenedentota bacterium]